MIRALLLPICVATVLSASAPAVAASIEGPWSVDPGQTVEMTVSGGVAGGRLEFWGPVTRDGQGSLLASGDAAGGSVPVTAPDRPGSYELRYVGPSGALLARREFEVAAVPIRLWVPEQMGAGVLGTVRWHGPAGPADMIQIVDPASGAVVSEAAAEGAPGAENATMIRAPTAIGDYHLRYVGGARGSVLRVLPVRVGPSRTWMRAPAHVGAGEAFDARWYGFPEPGQVFQIVDPSTGTEVATAQGEPAESGVSARLTAPRRAGAYRIRFVDTGTGQVHSDLPLHVGN